MLVCGKTPDKVDESKKVLILVSTRTFVFEIEMVSLKIHFWVYTLKMMKSNRQSQIRAMMPYSCLFSYSHIPSYFSQSGVTR